jgi:hypothetical protein
MVAHHQLALFRRREVLGLLQSLNGGRGSALRLHQVYLMILCPGAEWNQEKSFRAAPAATLPSSESLEPPPGRFSPERSGHHFTRVQANPKCRTHL